MTEQQRATGARSQPDEPREGEALPRYDLVCYLIVEWDRLPRRPHLTALAQFGRVLLVQVPMNIYSPLQKPRKFLRWLTGRDRLSQLSETMFMARAFMVVPFGIGFRYPWLRRVNRWFMARAMRGFVRRLGLQTKAAFIFDPAQNFFIGLANEELLCYEIIDDYASYPGISAAEREQTVREEAELLRRADIVFVPNSALYQEKSPLRPHTYVISNTVDVGLFARAQDPETQVPSDLELVPEPRIGYIGNINDLMDCDLLLHLSARHPEWSFVLLGRVNGTRGFRRSPAFEALRHRPNVYFLGWRDYTLLPSYLKGVSTCVLPWVNNHHTAYHQPNKLFQYLAAGKSVVSTALPQVRALDQEIGQLMGIAETYEEFEELLASALSAEGEGNEAAVQRRMQAANMFSADRMAWERVRRIAEVSASTS